MAVTHNIVLVANGITLSMQGDLESDGAATLKMDTDEVTVAKAQAVLQLVRCLGAVGNKFGAIITSLSVTAI